MVVPLRCPACRGPLPGREAAPPSGSQRDRDPAAICAGCELRLAANRPLSGGPPDGVDRIWSAAHHEGIARQLVSALKFGRLLPVAERIGAEIATRAPSDLLTRPLVPVRSSPARRRSRGFEPATEIAAALAARLPVGVVDCLERRGGSRQVGQSRGARRAARFVVTASAPVPPACLLVDDVATTGGTLTASAAALRAAGARRVDALTFSRRL